MESNHFLLQIILSLYKHKAQMRICGVLRSILRKTSSFTWVPRTLSGVTARRGARSVWHPRTGKTAELGRTHTFLAHARGGDSANICRSFQMLAFTSPVLDP